MTPEQLKKRTREFAHRVVDLCLELGHDELGRLVRRQLLRAGTGVAANYRSSCRARSSREFAARLGVVVEEADESEFWLDLITVKRPSTPQCGQLQREAEELRAILAASRTTTLANMRRRRAARKL